MTKMTSAVAFLALIAWLAPLAAEVDFAESLAHGKPVRFLPKPDYRLTVKGDTDETDLTDGGLSKYHRPMLWFAKEAVGWSYPGQVQVLVDLGEVEPIDEIGLRLQGGSPQGTIAFPGVVEAVVSDDGRVYHKVASCSKWVPGERKKYGVPPNTGDAWIFPLRFTNLKTRGRYVGLRMYASSLLATDEFWVMRGKHKLSSVEFDPADRVDFTIDGPQLYFHKPVVKFAANLALPIPVGIMCGEAAAGKPMKLILDIPRGVKLVALSGCKDKGEDPSHEIPRGETADAGKFIRRQFDLVAPKRSIKNALRIYLSGDWPEGKTGVLRYQVESETHRSPLTAVPIQATKTRKTPKPRRLLTSLGWYSARALTEWPDGLGSLETLGINTVGSFAHWMKPDDEVQWNLIESARKRGFRLLNIDSTFHRMRSKTGEHFCQFADGTHGKAVCPSYRGDHYKEELQRVADECARMKPDYLFTDIELWGWRGPVDAKKCTRCREDFKKSGLATWEEWQLAKGYEMWTDLVRAVREACEKAGGPKVEFGGYDFRAGECYQYFWPFDRLYPQYMQSSQVSTYTPLEPYHIALVGDEARTDREKLPRSDVIPWLTPGDAGTFSGDSFRYALWECYVNGSRGVVFWSGRLWDPELLVAMGRAIKAVVPVEDVIVDGDLFKDFTAQPPARVSGMEKGDDIVLLVADYAQRSKGTLTVQLPLKKSCAVINLDTGERLTRLPAGKAVLKVNLGDERAVLLHISPAR